MSRAASSTDTPASQAAAKRRKTQAEGLVSASAYADMVAAVQKSVKGTAGEGSGPMDTLARMKQERKEAKATSAAKTKEVRAYTKRVARLQARAAKPSDDGLLVEYARRMAAKEKKLQVASAHETSE